MSMNEFKVKNRAHEIGIMMTASPRTQRWFYQGILSWRDWRGGPVLLVYMDIDTDMLPLQDFMPPVTHVVCPGEPWGHRGGELMGIKFGANKLRELGIRYVFKSAADTAVFAHRGLFKLRDHLEESDVDVIGWKATLHFFAKTEKICEMFEGVEIEDIRGQGGCAETVYGRYANSRGIKRKGMPRDFNWEKELRRTHVHGQYARNKEAFAEEKFGPREAWKDGVIWPRV